MRHLLLIVFLVLMGCGGQTAPTSKHHLDKIVGSYMEETDYVGLAISAIKDGNVVLEKSYGFTDLEGISPFTVDEVVSLGSNAKTLTAASIVLLQDKGLLKLSDSLQDHLPFTLNHSDKVSLYEMLCHSSDLPDVFGIGEFENYEWQGASSQKEFIDKLNESSHEPDAGNVYRYNNTAYFLLGMVIEHLSHQSLGDFFREHFFNELASESIYYLGDSYYTPRMTNAFEKDGSNVAPYESPVEYRIVGGAGAIAGDLATYMRLFRDVLYGDLLSNSSQNQMRNQCLLKDGAITTNSSEQKIGLGIEITEFNGDIAYTRGGALNGYVSVVYYFPSKDLTVGIIGNTWAPLAPLLEKLFDNNWHNEI